MFAFQSLLDPFSALVLSIKMPIIKEKNIFVFMKLLLNESAAQAGSKIAQKKGTQKSRRKSKEENIKPEQVGAGEFLIRFGWEKYSLPISPHRQALMLRPWRLKAKRRRILISRTEN